MDAIERLNCDGLNVGIFVDPDPENPRRWDNNFGRMICFHPRYQLGDKHEMDPSTIRRRSSSREEALNNLVEEIEKNEGTSVYWLPLYLYDHSGLLMGTSRTYPFDDHWDAGLVGVIYVSKTKAREELGRSHTKERALEALNAEVETYSEYLSGDVYGYTIEDGNGEHLDSCWGFWGLDNVRDSAMEAAAVEATYLRELGNFQATVGL